MWVIALTAVLTWSSRRHERCLSVSPSILGAIPPCLSSFTCRTLSADSLSLSLSAPASLLAACKMSLKARWAREWGHGGSEPGRVTRPKSEAGDSNVDHAFARRTKLFVITWDRVFSILFFLISQDVIKRFVLYVQCLSCYHIPESEYMWWNAVWQEGYV